MIKIKRGPCPAPLKGSPMKGDHYNKTPVVQALHEMQHGKCCYCECTIHPEGHGKEVEHFCPKSIFEDWRNHWENLLLACSHCNGKKSDHFPVIDPETEKIHQVSGPRDERRRALIDPSVTNPEDHLTFRFDLPDPECGILESQDLIGKTTIEVFNLASSYFHRNRRRHYQGTLLPAYLRLLEKAKELGFENINKQKAEFEFLLQAEDPNAGFSRAFARHKKLDQSALKIQIPDIT